MNGARRPGQIQDWIQVAIGASVVLVPLLVHAVASLRIDALTFVGRETAGSIRYLPMLGVATLILCCLAPAGRLSRWVRAALLVPVLHLGVIVLAWALWTTYVPTDDYIAKMLATELPLVHAFPLGWTVAAGLGLLGGAAIAWTALRGRANPTWLGTAVTTILLHLLLLGLWLPILSGVSSEAPTQRPGTFLALLLGIPAAAALLIAVLVHHHAEAVASAREGAVAAFLIFLGIALVQRMSIGDQQGLAYANGFPLVAAEAVIALAAVLILGATHWRSLRVAGHDTRRGAPWTQRGVVEPRGGELVGSLHFPSWLHGLRTELQAFRLRTDAGVFDVPAGSRLVVPIPDASTSMRTGDVMPLLRAGDRVVVSGYVLPPSQGPYRTSAAPIPGDDGLVVTIEGAASPSWRDVALTLWRPCVLYLIAAGCVALPAFVGILPS